MSSLLSGPCFYDDLPADLRPLPDKVEETHRKDDCHWAEIRGRVPLRQLPAHHEQVTCKLSVLNPINSIHFVVTQVVLLISFLLYWWWSLVRRLHFTMEISERNRRFILPSRSWSELPDLFFFLTYWVLQILEWWLGSNFLNVFLPSGWPLAQFHILSLLHGHGRQHHC